MCDGNLCVSLIYQAALDCVRVFSIPKLSHKWNTVFISLIGPNPDSYIFTQSLNKLVFNQFFIFGKKVSYNRLLRFLWYLLAGAIYGIVIVYVVIRESVADCVYVGGRRKGNFSSYIRI